MFCKGLQTYRLLRAAAGPLLAAGLGVLLWATRLGDVWTNASYDALFLTSSRGFTNPLILILIDNETQAKLSLADGTLDRTNYVSLFNKLAAARCALVVADIRFEKARHPDTDQALARAMRRLPNLVLSAQRNTPSLDAVTKVEVTPLLPLFTEAVRGQWAVAQVSLEGPVRQHFPRPVESLRDSLPETAANRLGGTNFGTLTDKWIRYYDERNHLRRISLDLALEQTIGWFSNNIVFIGSQPQNAFTADYEPDKFAIPQTTRTGQRVGGLEILLTEFLNLINGDWLRRAPDWLEGAILLGSGLGVGFIFKRLPRRWLIPAVLGRGAGVAGARFWLSEATNYWFHWLIIAGGQLPAALVWCWNFPARAVIKTAIEPA